MNDCPNSGISVSWVRHHRRSAEIAQGLEFDPYYIRADVRLNILRYMQQWIQTRKILKAAKPSVVCVMQPPTFALWCVAVSTRSRETAIIGDLHSGVFFDPKWRWGRRSVLWILRRRGCAIVPNAELARMCADAGVPVVVSHGLVEPIERQRFARGSTWAKTVLVPLAYARDEPVNEILDAARLCPEVIWQLTGHAPDEIRASAPSNVEFTGFVSREEYLQLRLDADVVVALTTAEGTMQSAGYEALTAGTPLVTSRTRVLVDYFGDCACYTEPDPASISTAVRDVLENYELWRARMLDCRTEKSSSQMEPFEMVRAWLEDWRAGASKRPIGS